MYIHVFSSDPSYVVWMSYISLDRCETVAAIAVVSTNEFEFKKPGASTDMREFQ